MKFIEHFDVGYKKGEFKNHLPIIIGSIIGLLLIIGGILFFMLKPSNSSDKMIKLSPSSQSQAPSSHKSTQEITLYTAQNEWAVSEQTETAENKVWLESNDIVIKSASLYDEKDEKIADFTEDADNNMILYTIIGVPLDKAQELKYYAICETASNEFLSTKTITLKIVDKFPEKYYDSESKTDEQLGNLMNSNEYKNKTVDEKSKYLKEQLKKMSKQNPKSGEAYVVENSISYNKNTQSISFVEAAGTYCYVDLSEHEADVNSSATYSLKTNSNSEQYSFNGAYKNKVEGDAIILSALYESEQENYDYYAPLCEAINAQTSLDCTLEMATLDNLRTKLAKKEFIAIECHSYLRHWYLFIYEMLWNLL